MGETNNNNLPLHLRRLTCEEALAVKNSRMDSMFNKLTASQKEHYKNIPAGCRYNYLKAHTTNSMSAMVKAACNACFGYEDLKEAIPGCTSEICPLWSFRAGAIKEDE